MQPEKDIPTSVTQPVLGTGDEAGRIACVFITGKVSPFPCNILKKVPNYFAKDIFPFTCDDSQ